MVFQETLGHFPARALEWLSSFMMVTWGIQVIVHPAMFNEMPVLSGLLVLAPQNTWGLMAFSMGVIGLGALYINGRHTRTPLVRLICAFSRVFVWFWVVVGLLKYGWGTTGLALYPWLVLSDMYSAYRAASDVVEAEAQRRLQQLSNRSSDVSAHSNG